MKSSTLEMQRMFLLMRGKLVKYLKLIQVISVRINSKIKTGWGSTGNISMKLSDTHVNCVIKKRKKSLI